MYTPITIDKVRNFRYNVKALDLIEKKFKKNISSVNFGAMTVAETMVVAWAGLVHEDKELTPEKLIDLIDENNIKFTDFASVMAQAIADAYGEEEGENPNQAASA